MSSVNSCNRQVSPLPDPAAGKWTTPVCLVGVEVMGCSGAQLIDFGADEGFLKWDVGGWSGWSELTAVKVKVAE
jgi:hypothetical protein